MKKLALLVCFYLVIGCFSVLYAGDNADLTPEEAFGRIFAKDSTGAAAMFQKEFLKAVPEARLLEITRFYQDSLGSYQKVEQSADGFKLYFEKGTAPAKLSIGADNKIAGLWFGVPEKTNDSFPEIVSTFGKLPDRTSLCLLRWQVSDTSAPATTVAQPETIAELNADKPMGIGSSFKLYLLKALEDEIIAGRRQWSDVIELKEEWKSFPSGVLQDWHAGSRHTLETVAGLMISISDNTATDHIFHLLGRETVRRYLPETCKDTLNTSQMLKLKFFFPGQAEKFIKADAAGKDAVLAEIDAILPGSIASYSSIYHLSDPVMIDELEWFITTRKLCETIFSLKDSSVIKINPASGLVDKKDWHMVGFKGGSEPGVLNYTWVLQKTPASPVYTLSVTANNSSKPLDTDAFNVAVTRILNLLKAEK